MSNVPSNTNQQSRSQYAQSLDSMSAERMKTFTMAQTNVGSHVSFGHKNEKPTVDVPVDLGYNLRRWLQQKPSDEPWRGH